MPREGLRFSFAAAALAALAYISQTASGAIVFSDNFNRANNSTIGSNWTESNPGGGDVIIASNILHITSDSGNDTGNSFITQSTANFSAPWNNVLTNNTGVITWTFNMQSNNSDQSGFDSTQEANAFVLAATGSDFNTADGYAVVWGQSGSTDPIRLVKFASGLDANANLTNIKAATGASGTPGDPDANFMSVKITFDPTTDTWELFARSDGASAFADPTTGSYTSYGTAIDTTYTSSTITHIGLLGRYDKNNDDRLFDNVSVDVHMPEPASVATLGLSLVVMMGRRRFSR